MRILLALIAATALASGAFAEPATEAISSGDLRCDFAPKGYEQCLATKLSDGSLAAVALYLKDGELQVVSGRWETPQSAKAPSR